MRLPASFGPKPKTGKKENYRYTLGLGVQGLGLRGFGSRILSSYMNPQGAAASSNPQPCALEK